MPLLAEKTKADTTVTKERFYYNLKKSDLKFRFIKEDEKPSMFSLIKDFSALVYYGFKDKRFRKIFKVAFRLRNQILKEKVNGPVYVKNAFTELGSSFIKIGQFLSSRTDLLSKEYIEALSELQDSVSPMSYEEVKEILERELRRPIDTVFTDFEKEPIASASIGQVHRAKLARNPDVVIKVQRQNLSTLFHNDLSILRCLAIFFQKHFELGKDREWVQIIDEIGKTLFEEIDFIQEGKNADHLRKNLKYEDKVYIPKIFWKYTTKKAITIEYVPGIKITDIEKLKEKGFNPKEIILTLVNVYFKQFFEDGFYHADPHPGNIVVRDDGRIVFYDFGMVGRITKDIRGELASVLLSVVRSDTDTLIASLKKLKLLKQNADIIPIKKIIEQAVYDYYDGGNFNNLDLNGLEDEIKTILEEKPFVLPAKFTYALRATGTLEGICRTLDPDFSLVSVAKPYLENWLKDEILDSKWEYLKVLFPNQSKTIEKLKTYLDVIKELPKYVSKREAEINQTKGSENKNTQSESEFNKLSTINENLKSEVYETKSTLNLIYNIMFLLCFTFIGLILINTSGLTLNMLGLTLLILSILASIIMVFSAIVKEFRA